MEKVSILPQFVYKFTCPSSELLHDTLFLLKNEAWKHNINNFLSEDNLLHKNPAYHYISEWFHECLQKVKEDLEMECDELKITQCWANKSEFKQWHHPHIHSNSIVSGVFYVTDSNSSTWFSTSSIWNLLSGENSDNVKLTYNNNKNSIIHKQQTIQGDLIIFPSSLYHSVDEHLILDSDRYSISFNSFPSGKIGNFPSLSGMEIYVK